MGYCVNHPDRETNVQCLKYQVYLCDDPACMKCRDPELYCKFRSSCPIHFVDKEMRRRERQAAAG